MEFYIENYLFENNYIIEFDSRIRLQLRIIKTIRDLYIKLSKKKQKIFNQNSITLCYFLNLNSKREYKKKDLNNCNLYNRILKLLYCARFDQEREYTRILFYIRYNKLSKKIVQQINKSVELTEKIVKYLRAIAIREKTKTTE